MSQADATLNIHCNGFKQERKKKIRVWVRGGLGGENIGWYDSSGLSGRMDLSGMTCLFTRRRVLECSQQRFVVNADEKLSTHPLLAGWIMVG